MSDNSERDLELAREWFDLRSGGAQPDWIHALARLLARVRREEREDHVRAVELLLNYEDPGDYNQALLDAVEAIRGKPCESPSTAQTRTILALCAALREAHEEIESLRKLVDERKNKP